MRQNPVVFFLSELERKLSIVSSSKSFRAIESLLMVIVFERAAPTIHQRELLQDQ